MNVIPLPTQALLNPITAWPEPVHSLDHSFIVVISLLVFLLDGRLRNPIQISHAGLRDPPAALAAAPFLVLLDLLHDAEFLQRLQDLAVDGAGRVDVVRGPRAAVLGAAVRLAQPAHADRLAQVDVAGDGGGADVEPVGRLGREFVAV